MDVHKETISFAYLTSKSKNVVKEQQIKHNEVQIKKYQLAFCFSLIFLARFKQKNQELIQI
ncbi:hypothetical protein LEP1GSC100_0494 [Leptospira interrogans serovar Bataviae str. UI 08561]|nr:hypothetical protein LEP1GSC100_0494 [Leptospira interrogans serovar Bataviae str. UI 08561]